MTLGLSIRHILEEIACPDTPQCGWEHWRPTGERRPLFFIGSLNVPLPRFMLGYVQRKYEAMQ